MFDTLKNFFLLKINNIVSVERQAPNWEVIFAIHWVRTLSSEYKEPYKSMWIKSVYTKNDQMFYKYEEKNPRGKKMLCFITNQGNVN